MSMIEKEMKELKSFFMARFLVLEGLLTTTTSNVGQGLETTSPHPNYPKQKETAALLSPGTPSAAESVSELQPITVTLAKYHYLAKETKLSSLAVKLARESFFGEAVMSESTVYGARDKKQLPSEKVLQLKETLLNLCPQYKYHPHQFEPIWNKSCDAINHACAKLRSKSS